MERKGRFTAWLIIVLGAVTLVGESLLPDQAFLPLLPDDFPAWQAGRSEEDLLRHPAPNWTMSDTLHLHVPGLAVNRRALDRRQLPLWDPSQALGVPHLDQVLYSVLYPPAWLPLLLGFSGLAWMALLHLLVAGVGTVVYLRAIGRSWAAATLGGLCFAFSAWITARLHSFPVVGAAVWLPWILWGLERGASGGGLRPRVAAAVGVALSFLAGFPQVSLWVCALAALVEGLRAVAAARRVTPALRPLCTGLATLLLGVVLAAPQLVPMVHYMSTESLRGEQTLEGVLAEGLELPLLWHLVTPERYATAGLPGPHPIALMDLEQARNPAALNRAEVSMGVGLVGLILALVAMLFGRNWRTFAFTMVSVGVFVVLLWPAAMRELYAVMPLVRFGNPKRLLLLSTFALSVLAAGGLDLLRSRRIGVTVAGWFAALGAAALAMTARLTLPSAIHEDVDAWAGGLAQGSGLEGITTADVFSMIPRESFGVAADAAGQSTLAAVIMAFVAIVLLRPRRQHTQDGWSTHVRKAPWLPTLLVGAELIWCAWPLLRAAPLDGVSHAPDRIDQMVVPEVAKVLRTEAPSDAEGAAIPARVGRVGDDPSFLRPNFPSLFGLHDVQCYAPMVPRRVSELLEVIQPGITLSGSALGGFAGGEALASPLVDLLGVAAILTDRSDLEAEGFAERGRVGALRVLENREALPRAFFVTETVVLPDPQERLAYLGRPDFNPAAEVVVDDYPYPTQVAWRERRARAKTREVAGMPAVYEVDEEAGSEFRADSDDPRGVLVEEYEPGRMRLRVAPGPPGLIVVAETWHPGWSATLGSDEVPVWVADHALMAVPVETTQEVTVTLSFAPALVTGGWLLGAGAWLLAAVLLGVPRRVVLPEFQA